MIDGNRGTTTREIPERLNLSNDTLIRRQRNDPFLKRIVTDDEKWVVYNNVKRKRTWSKKDEPARTISKLDIHLKKVMLSVWWDLKRIVYFEQQLVLKFIAISWTN